MAATLCAMKSALIVRHTPYEGIAGFRLPVEQAGYVIDRVDVTDPEFERIDFLSPDLVVLMGGPMGWKAFQHSGIRSLEFT